MLGICLAEPATNEARRTRLSQRTRCIATADKDSAGDGIPKTVDEIYLVLRRNIICNRLIQYNLPAIKRLTMSE
jgi:hypothetical protein